MRRSLLILALGALLVPAAFACGDDDDDGGDDATPTIEATATPTAEEPEDTATPTEEATPEPTAEDLPGFEPADSVLSADHEPGSTPQLVDVRVGQHEGYDRIVFEFEGDEMPPWEVQYVAEAIACGSGKATLVGGNAVLEVAIPNAQAHGPDGQSSIPSTDLVARQPAIVQAIQTCDFEARVSWAVGTEAMQPFRVLELSAPTRLVVDIEHP